MLAESKVKAVADGNFNVTEKLNFLSGICGYQLFLNH